jgi:hypothetical protein
MDANKSSTFNITDTKIISYYADNPQLDFINMNHIFIDILKNISSKLTYTSNPSSIQQMKDDVLTQNHFQDKLTNELNDFLNKYKNNSSIKENDSKMALYHMLQVIMPHDEIINVTELTSCCDFKVNRKNKENPTILFENKDYINNVTTDEVKKFEKDIQLQKSHGIFISQKTPITYKENFQIDIIDGLIHVYLSNVNYDADKIKIAIEIIDNLSSKILLIEHNNDDNGFLISKTELDDIADEYRIFGIQKMAMQDTIKTMNKQLLEKLEEMQLPKIKKILIKLGNIENDNDFKCGFCNIWSGKNKASLAAHIRNCKCNNQKGKTSFLDIDNSINTNSIVIEPILDETIIQTTQETSVSLTKPQTKKKSNKLTQSKPLVL